MDLLQQIYEIVKGHNNIFIITSCRTCDRTAFVKIENIYQIKRYDIFLLSDKQIIKVAQKYKIVQKLWDAKGYVQLLRSPFYRKRLNFRHGYKNPRPHFCNRSTLIIHI